MLFMSPVALGDFLYAKTFLIALKQQYPDIKLDIWLDDIRCNQDEWRLSRSKILQQWMEAEGICDTSYGCTGSKAEMQQQIASAKECNYDIIFCHTVSKSARFSAIAKQIAPSSLIVSSIPTNQSHGWLDKLFFRHSDHLFVLDEASLPKAHHITDRYHKIFSSVMPISLSKQQLMPSLTVPSTTESITQTWLQHHFSDPKKQGKLLFLNHLSTNEKKDWQIEQLFELIKKIAQTDDTQRFIINVTKESYDEVTRSVDSFLAQNPYQVAVFTVEKHFFELPSLISQADFVITVDTAILHFAFAANRPLLAMMRQKKPYWAPPTTDRAHVLYATEGKGYISDISVDTVYQQYQKMTAACE